MDKERKKRLRAWKIILTDAIIVVLVATVAVILSFVAMGYKFGDDGKLDQSGLLQAESTPTGATIIVDGEPIFFHTNTNHLLPEGNHQVRLEREGYTGWENTLTIKSGRLYKLNYPRLFKLNREAKTVKDFADKTLKFVLISPDRKNILYQVAGSPNWSLMQIDRDTPEITEFDTSIMPGEFLSATFGGGDKLLTKWNNNGIIEYRLIDLAKPDKILDINKEFGLNFTKISFLSGSELFGLESGNLRKLSISDRATSRVLLSNIADFSNDEQKIAYVTAKDEVSGERTVGFYQDEAKNQVVKKSTADNIRVTTTKYLDERYIGVVAGDELEIFQYKDEGSVIAKTKLDFVPDEASTRVGRLVIFSKKSDDGAHLAIYDAERDETFKFKLESREFSWLDDYLIGNAVVDEGTPNANIDASTGLDANVAAHAKLYARDFDGTNRRGLAAKVKPGYNAVISRNNKWLYYFATSDSGSLELKREEL